MQPFTFHVDQPDSEPFVRSRNLDDESQAFAYARQLLQDWPESRMIDVMRGGELLSRLRRHAA